MIASAMSNHDPSVAMASDVLDIAMRMRDRLERKDVVRLVGVNLPRIPT